MSQIDDNLNFDGDKVTCRQCGTTVGDRENILSAARVVEAEATSAGPSVRADPKNFTKRPVVLRRTLCPTCLVQLQFEIVPGDEPSARTRKQGAAVR